MKDNLSSVQQIYTCFGQGDIPGILDRLADNVRFFNAADPAVAPFGGVFEGKNGVLQFFGALQQYTQTTHFEPSNFRADGNRVINEVRHDGVARTTNKPFSVTATFTWTFDEDGKAVDWTSDGDFSTLNAALKA